MNTVCLWNEFQLFLIKLVRNQFVVDYLLNFFVYLISLVVCRIVVDLLNRLKSSEVLLLYILYFILGEVRNVLYLST